MAIDPNDISWLINPLVAALQGKMPAAGKALADAFTKEVGKGGVRTAAGTIAGAVGMATATAGAALGGPAGQAVGAGGALVTGAVGMATAGGPIGAAAAGLAAVATAAKEAGSAIKGFAAAASPDGLKFLSQAFDILSSAVGAKLLPFFVELGAAVAAAGEELASKLVPQVGETAKWFAENQPIFVAFGKAVVAIAEALIDLAGRVLKIVGHFTNNDAAKGASDAVSEFQKAKAAAAPGDKTEAAGPKPAAEKSFNDRVDENKDLIIQQMSMSLSKQGGKGGVGSIEDAYKKATEAAMGGGLEQKQLRIWNEILKEMRQGNRHTGKTAQATGEVAGRPPVVKK